ncbi:MAG: 3-hydroxy acid dehydrogenase/malonic semialdehyde reductase [Pseudohongiellaceae bacterium]|jgi:3-hydroxy acid dehydrogenase/malonic semialdehyde reductase
MTNSKGQVLVSGSSSGIGLAMTSKLIESGYSVVGLDQTEPAFAMPPERFTFVPVQLSDSKAMLATLPGMFESIQGPIRCLINNAGIGKMGFLEQLSVADLQLVMQVNFMSHALLTKLLLARLKQQNSLVDIVFIGSEAALSGARQGSIYCASKFAVRGFSQALRQECAKSKVRVTLINPGAVRTPFFDELDFEPGPLPTNAIEPDDIAQALLSVLEMRPGTVIEEMNLSPMTHVWQRK